MTAEHKGGATMGPAAAHGPPWNFRNYYSNVDVETAAPEAECGLGLCWCDPSFSHSASIPIPEADYASMLESFRRTFEVEIDLARNLQNSLLRAQCAYSYQIEWAKDAYRKINQAFLQDDRGEKT